MSLEEDYSYATQKIYGDEEIEYKQKMKMFGNMRLICELYTIGEISEKVIIECFSSLFNEPNDQKVEIICQMTMKIANFIIGATIAEGRRKRKPKTNIDIPFLQTIIDRLFELQTGKLLSSRVKFKIQDIRE